MSRAKVKVHACRGARHCDLIPTKHNINFRHSNIFSCLALNDYTFSLECYWIENKELRIPAGGELGEERA